MRIPYPTCKVTLGGWLSMANGTAILIFALLARILGSDPQMQYILQAVSVLCILPLTLPLAIGVMIPRCGGGPTLSEVISSTLLVGINCFAWGYGLEYLLKKASKRQGPPEEDATQNHLL